MPGPTNFIHQRRIRFEIFWQQESLHFDPQKTVQDIYLRFRFLSTMVMCFPPYARVSKISPKLGRIPGDWRGLQGNRNGAVTQKFSRSKNRNRSPLLAAEPGVDILVEFL
jgi:hypothetical protein